MAADSLIISEAKINDEAHVPSKLHPDTLFHFASKMEWLLAALKGRMLSARYCCENLEAFQIPGLKKMAYPMKCFCDINLHKLRDHIDWYGPYGIAFSKEWGMNHGVQPVQYINPQSPICRELAAALGETLSAEPPESESVREKLENVLLLELLYWKPYQGMEKKRESGESSVKCFSDESEWRFIPSLYELDMPMIIRDENIIMGGLLNEYSEVLQGREIASIVFSYDDVKHIILRDLSDYIAFEEELNKWDIDSAECKNLLSKVLIWNNIKEDV